MILKIILISLTIGFVGSTTAILDHLWSSTVTSSFSFKIGYWTSPVTPPNPPKRRISDKTYGCGVTLITNPTTQSVDFLKFPIFGCGFPTC